MKNTCFCIGVLLMLSVICCIEFVADHLWCFPISLAIMGASYLLCTVGERR